MVIGIYEQDADNSSGEFQPSENINDWLPTRDGDDRQDGQLSRHAALSSVAHIEDKLLYMIGLADSMTDPLLCGW